MEEQWEGAGSGEPGECQLLPIPGWEEQMKDLKTT